MMEITGADELTAKTQTKYWEVTGAGRDTGESKCKGGKRDKGEKREAKTQRPQRNFQIKAGRQGPNLFGKTLVSSSSSLCL